MQIESERTLLRRPRQSDVEQIFAYRSDAETNRYQDWIPKDIEEVEAFVARIPEEFNIPETWHQLVVLEKESGDVIGDIGVHFVGADNRQCEFGFTLAKGHQGRGLATEATGATIDYLFTQLGKHRITASVDPRNGRSIALLERLGFRKEGHFREALMMNGEWVDDVIYAMLRREWGNQVPVPTARKK